MALPRDPDPYTERFCQECERLNNLKNVERTEPVEPAWDEDGVFICQHHGRISVSETKEVEF